MEEEKTIQAIKDIVDQSKSFAILLQENSEEHQFLLKEALAVAISAKSYPVMSVFKQPEEQLNLWLPLTADLPENKELPRKTSINLPKEKYNIKEVSYQEKDNNLSLIITSDSSVLKNEDITLETLLPEPEMVFCLFENPSKTNLFQKHLTLPPEEKIIFLTSDKKTLVEKVAKIIKMFDNAGLEKKEINSLLFASLLLETDNFSKNVGAETLALASELIKKGTQEEIINEIKNKEKELPFVQLLGRILARTYIDEILNISWSFLNQRDFQKTNSAHTSFWPVYRQFKKIKSLLPKQGLHILLWQSSIGIEALILLGDGGSEEYFDLVSGKLDTSHQNHFLKIGPFENFSQAEIFIRGKLK